MLRRLVDGVFINSFWLENGVSYVPALGNDTVLDAGGEYEIGGQLVGATYTPPSAVPSAEQLRISSFMTQPDRIDIVNRLKTATPAQIDAWILANVTSIATARTVLGAIIKAIALDIRS
jgi:hypothetical protein